MPVGLSGAGAGAFNAGATATKRASGGGLSKWADTSKYSSSIDTGIAGNLTPAKTNPATGMGGALGGALGNLNNKNYGSQSDSIIPIPGLDAATEGVELENWYKYMQALGGPSMAALQNAAMGAYAGHNLSQAQAAAQAGYYNSELGYGNRGIDLDMAGLGIDRQGNVIDREGIGIDTAYYNKSKDIANRQLGNTLGSLMYEGVKQTRANNSANVSKGSWFAPGREYENQNIYKETAAAGDKARLGHEKEISGYDRSIAQLGLDEKRTRLADQQLDIASQKLGLKKEQLFSQFQKSMSDLGFDQQEATLQLTQMLSSNNAAQQELAMQWLTQAIDAKNRY